MKIKHHEIEIPEENPFVNCKLAREPYARVLTNIVNSFADGFVLAINNEWGAGKTTFVKMWQQQLKNEGFQTIYFNAWENDFDHNPLVALMSELETLTNGENEKTFKSVVEKGAVLVKNIAPALVKSLIKKYVIDIDEIVLEGIENAAKASTEIFEEEIKEYAKKKKTISEFKKELEKFVKKEDSDKPLIFIVDELDRCRPNYAVEVLEQIKHFFSVKGIVFVLSIDKNHLESSVKGFYGSEQIDSKEYLRRFIDLEYSIPKPSTGNFIRYLYDYYSFKDFFTSPNLNTNHKLKRDQDGLIQMAELVLTKSNATLRQQEKIFGLTRLILNSFQKTANIFPEVLFLLVYFKEFKTDFYKEIDDYDLSLEDLSRKIDSLIFYGNSEIEGLTIAQIKGLFLWLYNNNKKYSGPKELFVRDDQGTINVLIGDQSLADFFDVLERQSYERVDLKYFIRKINLTQPLVAQ
jgi:nucleoside-triphosphatase THEP1